MASLYLLYSRLVTIFHTLAWARNHFLSALLHAALSFLSSGVYQGLDFLAGLMIKGACLFKRLVRVESYRLTSSLRSVGGAIVKIELEISVKNSSILTFLICRKEIDLGMVLVSSGFV